MRVFYRLLLESMPTGLLSGEIESLQMSPYRVAGDVIVILKDCQVILTFFKWLPLVLQELSARTGNYCFSPCHSEPQRLLHIQVKFLQWRLYIPPKTIPWNVFFAGCAGTIMWTETLTRCCKKYFIFSFFFSIFFCIFLVWIFFLQSCFEEAQSLLQVAPSGDYR